MASLNKNNFNFLRFVLASLVIVSHAPELQDGGRENEILSRLFGVLSFGELAVNGFFVLSGYLIVKSWIAAPQIKWFLLSRVLRIYPGFIAASLVCAFVVGPIFGSVDYFDGFPNIGFLFGLVKLKLVGIPPVFDGTAYAVLNGAMWSIPYEFYCYIFVLVCGLLGIFKRRSVWLLVFMLFLGAYFWGKFGGSLRGLGMHARLAMLFASGGLIYLYQEKIVWNKYIAWGAFLLVFISLPIRNFVEPVFAIFGGYFLIYFARFGRLVLGFDRWPDVSYGMYLYAWPINKIVLWYFPGLNVYLLILVVFVLSVVAGLLSCLFVERPFLRLKSRFL